MSTVEVIFLSTSILTFAIGLVIVAINPWRMINRCYLAAATLSALWLFCIFVAVHIGQSEAPESRQHDILFWLRMTNAVAAFLPCSYFLLKSAIIGWRHTRGLRARPWPWIVASCLLATLAFSESFIPSHSTPKAHVRGVGYAIYTVSLSTLCILVIFDAAKEMNQCNGIRRLEMKFFVFNLSLATLAILFTFVASNALTMPALRYAGPYLVVASSSLTIWAICHHRVFDARQVFANIGRSFSTLVVLTVSINIADAYLPVVLSEPYALTVSACCGALVATYWDRKAIRWLNLDAKQILAGPRNQIIEWAHEEPDANKLMARFEMFLREWCHADSVTFHTAETNEPTEVILQTNDYANTFPLLRQTGYITSESLARRRPDIEIQLSKALLSERNLAALIAVPRGSHSPSCLVAFGCKQSLRPYTYPDIQLLIELVELMDNILMQAQVATRTAQIEKMAAAAMMSRGLAHDLNNLATPVSSFLLHMENRVLDGTPEADVLNAAKHSVKVMQDYIRECLFFARRLVPDFQNMSTSELLNSTVKVTQSRAQTRSVRVVTESRANMDFVADRALILRLMQNLVLNGIDATPCGGQVTISAGAAESGGVYFSVSDEGLGVPAEHVDHIFEPYFTTKDTGDEIRGLGLGLAISQKISGLHGGELMAGRAPCGGAVFTFILPEISTKLVSRPENPINHDHPNSHSEQPEAKHSDEHPCQRLSNSFNSGR